MTSVMHEVKTLGLTNLSIEQFGLKDIALDLYSESDKFKCQMGHQLPRLRLFTALLSPSRQML